MADIKITDLVDEKVFEELEKLSSDIKSVKDKYVEAATELAKGLNMKISTSGDLAKFNEIIAESGKKAYEATEQLNTSIERQRTIVGQTTNVISRELAEIEKENKAKRDAFAQDKSALEIAESIIGTRDQNILRLSKLQTELKGVKDAQKSLDDAVKSGTVSESAAAQKRAENLEKQRTLKAAIQDLNNVLNNQDKQMQAAEGSYQKLSLQLEMLKKAYKGLNEEEKNSDIGKQLAEEIGNMDAHLKDLAADMGEFQRNTGNYAIANQSVKTELRELVQEIATLTLQYRSMSEEEKKSAAGQELEQKMDSLKARASELKDAVADVNREIQSGANDTKNFSAITEGVNLLISGVGGLTAASHALGLGEKDLIKIQTNLQASLVASNALVKAQTVLQKESNLMKGVARLQEAAHATAIKIKTAAEGESIIVTKAATVAQAAFNKVAMMNPYVLLATGIGLLVASVFSFTKATKEETEEQKKAREEMERSKREYEEMMDTTEQLNKAREEGIDSCSAEIAKLKVLYTVATDTTRSLKERKLAVEKLQEIYPDYLGNLEQEAILSGNARVEIEKLSTAIISNAIAKAQLKKIEEYAEKYEDVVSKIAGAQEKLNEFNENPRSNSQVLEAEKIWRDRADAGEQIARVIEQQKTILEMGVFELSKQADDYDQAMKKIIDRMNVSDLLSGIGNSKTTTTTSSNDAKEETTKTYEEIEEVILEYTQEIIAERIALTKEGSEEEYNLTLQYIEAERQLRLIEIEKGYTKEKKALDDSLANKTISQEEYNTAIKQLEDARNNQSVIANQKVNKAKEDAHKKYTDAVIASIEEMYAKEQEERDLNLLKELTDITENRARQLITEEEYQRQLAEKKQKYAIETAQKEIEMLEKVLDAEAITAEKRKEIAEELKKAKAELAKETADVELKNTKKVEKQEDSLAKKRENNIKKLLQEVSKMARKVSGLMNAIYDGQIQKIEEEEEEQERAHNAEVERIERLEETGAISKEEAEARKRAAEQRTAEEKEKLEKKKQELKHKQAVWDKATSIVEATIATAVGITEALKLTWPLNIVMAALVGAMGAVEIATIAATPIPTYAKGTKDKDGHPGGYAIVGDAGKREAVIYNSKMWITPDTPTLVDIPKGAVVYPDAERVPEPVFMTVDNTGANNSKPMVIVSHDSRRLERGVAQTNQLIKQSIIMQKRIAYDAAYQSYKRTRL